MPLHLTTVMFVLQTFLYIWKQDSNITHRGSGNVTSFFVAKWRPLDSVKWQIWILISSLKGRAFRRRSLKSFRLILHRSSLNFCRSVRLLYGSLSPAGVSVMFTTRDLAIANFLSYSDTVSLPGIKSLDKSVWFAFMSAIRRQIKALGPLPRMMLNSFLFRS